MEDYSSWEKRRLSVDALRLDRRNPRLVGDSLLDCTQLEILHLLVEQSDVRDIARRISKNGYFSFFPPIVFKEKKHFVVLEGNRRLAALKLLRNPELSPVAGRRFFLNLSTEFEGSSVEKIDVIIAPSRAAADPILYTVHGSGSSRKWDMPMRQRFIAGQVANGVEQSEIARKFNVAETEVKEAVTEVLLLDMAKSLDFEASIAESIQSEGFPLSTLYRIVTTARFGKITGFALGNASFSTVLSENDFKKFMRQIFIDIVTGVVDSRKLGDEKSRTDYLDGLGEKYISKESDLPWEYIPKKDEEVDVVPEPRRRRPRQARKYLIPEADLPVTGHQKLDALISEGKIMPLGMYQNSAGLLLRTIMQFAICRVIENSGERDDMFRKNGDIKGLKELLEWLVKSDKLSTNSSFRDRIRRLYSYDNVEFMNIRTLHDYVHDMYQQPDKTALSNFWGIIKEILELAN